MEQPVLYEEKAHTGAVLEELQAMRRTYTGAVCSEECGNAEWGGKDT